MAFTHKLINVTFSIANGGTTYSTLGLRTTVRIQGASGPTMIQADVAIYGMPLSVMNALSTTGTQITQINKNTMTISAGDDVSGLSLIYTGQILFACVDAQNMPEVCFRATAIAGSWEAAMPGKPLSYNGSTDVAQIMQDICNECGLQFENNGVQVKLPSPYFWGSPRSKILTVAEHAGIEQVIDRGTLAIWPPGQSRSGNVIASPETGLVAYPMFNQSGVIVRMLFDPSAEIGGTVTIQSAITPANGTWIIIALEWDLESITPHGQWFVTIHATTAGGPSQTVPTS